MKNIDEQIRDILTSACISVLCKKLAHDKDTTIELTQDVVIDSQVKELSTLIASERKDALMGFVEFLLRRNREQIVDEATDEAIGWGLPTHTTHEDIRDEAKEYLKGGK